MKIDIWDRANALGPRLRETEALQRELVARQAHEEQAMIDLGVDVLRNNNCVPVIYVRTQYKLLKAVGKAVVRAFDGIEMGSILREPQVVIDPEVIDADD